MSDRDEAFEGFFEAESSRLARLGTFLTGDAERGADLAQEAMVRTYVHWSAIREEPGPYTRRTLVNLVRSEHRKALVRRRHQPEPAPPEESRDGSVDEWVVVTAALQRLSPLRRAAIVLRFYEDLPEREIAQILDRPLGTVKSDIHRALAQLRPLLGDVRSNETPRLAITTLLAEGISVRSGCNHSGAAGVGAR